MIKVLKHSAFSLTIVGSNGTDMKLYLIVATYFEEAYCIKSSLLSLPNLVEDSTCEICQINSKWITEIWNPGIELDSVCRRWYGSSDGPEKKDISFLKNHQNVGNNRLPLPIINLAAEKAAAILPVNIDKILNFIYY